MSRFIIIAIICLVLILVFYLTIWRTWLAPSPPKKKVVKPPQVDDKEKKQPEESESSTDGKE